VIAAFAGGLALYALDPADARGDRNRRAGPPAAIEFEPDPLHIRCDGRDASRLTVHITDERGKDVKDGTEVLFAVRDGFADPVTRKTDDGEAKTRIRLYPSAAFAGGGEVIVYAGELEASIFVNCKGAAPPGCNPFSPPQHPLSPPCPEPTPTSCPTHPMSPPCLTATPTVTSTVTSGGGDCASPPSPACVPSATPTPFTCPPNPTEACITLTPTPTVTHTPTSSVPLYDLGVAAQTQADNTVTVAAYILSTGGGPYQAVQWFVDYPEAQVNLLSIERASPAPEVCNLTNDDGTRALLGCIDIGGGEMSYFGDAYIMTFECEVNAAVTFLINTATDSTSAVFDFVGVPHRITTTDATVGCGTDISTPVPTATPTPTPLFQLGFSTTATDNVVTTELLIRDVGGGAYDAAQWHLDFPESLLDVVSIAPAPGAPAACDDHNELAGSLIVRCAGDDLTYFGTTYIVTFHCLGAGDGNVALIDDGTEQSFVSAGGVASVLIDQLTDSGPGWTCSGAAP
jgi:hypothetical protein